jgi:hypothetical protein
MRALVGIIVCSSAGGGALSVHSAFGSALPSPPSLLPLLSFRRKPESSPRGTRGGKLDPDFRRGDAMQVRMPVRHRDASQRPGFADFPLNASARGWRAERRKAIMVRVHRWTRGRLSARHMRSCSEPLAHAHLRRFSDRTGPAFAVSVPRIRRFVSFSPPWREVTVAFDMDLTVVSQLLAGPLNGPGGSPVAARVPGQRTRPAGRRTSSRLTTPHESAPQWTR